jgi:hypothetical protein
MRKVPVALFVLVSFPNPDEMITHTMLTKQSPKGGDAKASPSSARKNI